MIERTNAFRVGTESFLTLEDAQRHELILLMTTMVGATQPIVSNVTDYILSNKVKILDILTTTQNSKPRARRINGGTKKRVVITNANTSADLVSA